MSMKLFQILGFGVSFWFGAFLKKNKLYSNVCILKLMLLYHNYIN